MEQNALDTTVRKFANTVQKYNETQVEYDKNVKSHVKQVLKAVVNKTDQEIDELVESGNGIEAIRSVFNALGAQAIGDDGKRERNDQDERASGGGDVHVGAEHPALHGAAESDVYGPGVPCERAGREYR